MRCPGHDVKLTRACVVATIRRTELCARGRGTTILKIAPVHRVVAGDPNEGSKIIS